MIFKNSVVFKIFLSIFCLFTIYTANAQLTVNNTMTPAQLVQNVLLGSGVTASNITYSGDPSAIGSFNGSASNIGLPSGIIMASGDIANAIGPNNTGGQSTGFGTSSSDPDLSAIASGSINDAAILEFDFVPTSDTIKFKYVFGSEEYMEYANSSFNDVFGFFISGPIPSGGNYASQNIAFIPGTILPVSINNVNLFNNGAYYFDNGDGNGTGTAADGVSVQYDGFTVTLTAKASVVCGQTYHIKLAIGDVADGSLDSGVFLEAGSFSSLGVSVIPQISYGGPNDSTLYEGCGVACIYFVRTANILNQDTINLVLGGTAINGTDYYDNNVGPGTPFPTQLIFPAGQDSISFCINALDDGSAEGLETFDITILPGVNGLCVQAGASATIYINEYAPLVLSTSNDTTLCNILSPVQLIATVTGGVEPYTYSWTNGAGTMANPIVNPTINTTYIVTVNDACTGSPDPTPALIDSVSVSLVTIPVITTTVSFGGTNDSTFYEGCGQACIYFVRTVNIAQPADYTLSMAGAATNGVDYSPALPASLVFAAGQDSLSFCINAISDGTAETTETVLVSINIPGVCNLNASATLYIAEPPPLIITNSNDTVLYCVTGPVNLFVNASGGILPYTYAWSNIAESVNSQTVTPSSSTTYTITVSDNCNGTPDPTPDFLDSIQVTVNIPAPLSINAVEDIVACPDDIVNLGVTATGGALPLSYVWTTTSSNVINAANTTNASVIASGIALYVITITDSCGNMETDQVSVDAEQNCLLIIPNVISPDNSGSALNEFFYIENLDRFPACSLIIYNRWGNKIFETSNYQNNWNGSKYPDGTYYYMLTVPSSGQVLAKVKPSGGRPSFDETIEGSNKVFVGFFQIVR